MRTAAGTEHQIIANGLRPPQIATCILWRALRYFALVLFHPLWYGRNILQSSNDFMGRTTILFAACVLLANGLVGERGLTQTLRARRASDQAGREIARLERENATLREMIRRLRDDPAAIESAARSDLGLVRPGEILITIRDVKP